MRDDDHGGRLKVHGLLLLDKPQGLSSNAAMQAARRLYGADKAGHGGTLDPMAEGLLPVMFGEACKLAESALEGDKGYEATILLGRSTTTDDTEGEIVSTAPVSFTDAQLDAVLDTLRGRIVQVPPVYSALKVAGKALYRYAREGNPRQAAARQVSIRELQLLGRRHGDEPSLSIRVVCSKGTYIRSLARDIGAALGCGAHLGALRRTRVGQFTVDSAIGLDALAAMAPQDRPGQLIGLEALVSDWPAVTLDGDAARLFCQGQAVAVPCASIQDGGGLVRGTVFVGGSAIASNDGPTPASEASVRCGGPEHAPKIAVNCGGRLIGLGRRTLPTESTCALAPVRIIVP